VDSRYAMSQDPSLAAEPHLKSRKSSRIEGSSTNLEPEISGTISILELRPETDLPYSDSFLILALILDPNPNANHPTPLRTCRFPTKIQEKFFFRRRERHAYDSLLDCRVMRPVVWPADSCLLRTAEFLYQLGIGRCGIEDVWNKEGE